jgi:hypothetical protein
MTWSWWERWWLNSWNNPSADDGLRQYFFFRKRIKDHHYYIIIEAAATEQQSSHILTLRLSEKHSAQHGRHHHAIQWRTQDLMKTRAIFQCCI